MGLLDKAGQMDKKPETKTAKMAAKPMKKAKAVVKSKDTPKPVKAKRVAKPARQRAVRPSRDLPDEFVSAGRTNRAAAWLVNFAWNWGVLIAVMSILIFTGSGDLTWPLLGGLALPLINVLIIPAKFGRNIGEFVSRTKYINWKGEKPFFLHGILTNINTPALFAGLGFLAMSGLGSSSSKGVESKMIIFSILCLAIPLAEYIFKKIMGGETKQGMWDKMYGAYLVHHVPTGKETGWLARLESLGDFGAKRIAKIDEKLDASAKEKAEKSQDADDS